mgnify:CR=1 FL=1
MTRTAATVLSLFFLQTCQFPSGSDDPELVSNLRFSPSAFDSFRTNTELRYTLKSPAKLSIYVAMRDSIGSEFLVKKLAENIEETKGTHAHTWLGDATNGQFAPRGSYIGVVLTGHQRYEAAVLVFHF